MKAISRRRGEIFRTRWLPPLRPVPGALAGALLTYEDPAELASALRQSPLAEWFGGDSHSRQSRRSGSRENAEGSTTDE